MSELEQEVASQPEMWRRAAALAPQARTVLPPIGARVALIGCGTSWFVARSAACLRETLGLGETDAFTASEMPLGRRYDASVVRGTLDPMAELVRTHLVAAHKALDADNPRHLTRSVVLPP
jgi:hypothetical protein